MASRSTGAFASMSERSAQIAKLRGMGFHPSACQRALQVTNGSLDRAIDWLLSIQNSIVDQILSNARGEEGGVDHFAACFSDLQAGSSSSVTPRSQRARLKAASGALDDECRSPVSLDECVSGFCRLQMRDSDEQNSADNSSDSPESAWRASWRAGDDGNRSQAFPSRERFPMPSRDLSFGQYSNVGEGNACGKRVEGRKSETNARGRKGERSANASLDQSRRSAGRGNADFNQHFERWHPQTAAAPFQSFTASPEQKAEANLRRGRIPNLPKHVKDKLHQICHSADTIGKFSKMKNPFFDPASKHDPAAQLFLDSMTQVDPAPIKLSKKKIAQLNEALVKRGQMELSPSAKRIANKIVHATDTVGPWSQTPNEFRDPDGKYDPEAQELLNQMKAASLGLEFANSGYQDFVERHALDPIALEQLEQIEGSKGFITELQFDGLLQQIVRMSADREVQAQRQAGSNVPFEPCFSHRHQSDDDFQRDRQSSDESDEAWRFARAEFRRPIGANISRGDAARG